MFGRLFLFLRGEPVGQMATGNPNEKADRADGDGTARTAGKGRATEKTPADGRNLHDKRNPDNRRHPSSGRGPKRLQNPPAGYCGIKI